MTECLTTKCRVFGLLKLAAAVALLSVAANFGNAQTTSATDKLTPQGLAPGSPVGSYALNGFENVNLFNGNLNFHLPLLGISGRGGAGMEIMEALNTKTWRVRRIQVPDDLGGNVTYTPTQNPTLPQAGYGPGLFSGRQSGVYTQTCYTTTQKPRKLYQYTVTKLTFTAPDGTQYELRDQTTNGQPLPSLVGWGGPCPGLNQGPSRGTVFITADGSAATFISDTTIYDTAYAPAGMASPGFTALSVGISNPAGRHTLPDRCWTRHLDARPEW